MSVYKNTTTKFDKKTNKERTITTYRVSVRYIDWQGKHQRHTKRGFPTKKEAKEYEAKFLAEASNSCSMLFEDLVVKYMENRKLKNLKVSTLTNKQFIIDKHLLPTFGKIEVDTIKATHIEAWQKALLQDEANYALTYIYTINNLLKSILYYAVRVLGLQKNPADATEKIGIARNDDFNYWTQDEFNKFMTVLLDKEANAKAGIRRKCNDYILSMAFILLFYTGLREGELLALTGNDIDVANRTITISKTYKRIKGKDLITYPKTKSGNRKIKISEGLAKKLEVFLTAFPERKANDRIFESLNVSSLYRAIHSTAKLAGLKEIRIHDLRHSCCSLLFHIGCNPQQVKAYLGHKNIQITLNVYAHLYPESFDEVTEKIQEVENLTSIEFNN